MAGKYNKLGIFLGALLSNVLMILLDLIIGKYFVFKSLLMIIIFILLNIFLG